jgi:hypothetical protein
VEFSGPLSNSIEVSIVRVAVKVQSRKGSSYSRTDCQSQMKERRRVTLRTFEAVCSFYRWARHEGVTDANPTPFRRPRPDRDAVVTLGLDPAQVHAVLDAALSRGDTQRNYVFVSLLVFCGLWVSEALGADVDDLADARGHRVIRVMGKGGKPRSVPMPPQVIGAADAYLDGHQDGPVCHPHRAPVVASGCLGDRRGHRSVGRGGQAAPAHVPAHRGDAHAGRRRSVGSRADRASVTPRLQRRWGTHGHGTGWTRARCTTSPATWRRLPQFDLEPAAGPDVASGFEVDRVPRRVEHHVQRDQGRARQHDDDGENDQRRVNRHEARSRRPPHVPMPRVDRAPADGRPVAWLLPTGVRRSDVRMAVLVVVSLGSAERGPSDYHPANTR